MRKLTFLLLIILFPISSFATFEKVIECDNGAMVIDKESNFLGTKYQVVIRDKNIINIFRSQGITGNVKSNYQELIFGNLEYHNGSFELQGGLYYYFKNYFAKLNYYGDRLLGVDLSVEEIIKSDVHKADWYFRSCFQMGDITY